MNKSILPLVALAVLGAGAFIYMKSRTAIIAPVGKVLATGTKVSGIPSDAKFLGTGAYGGSGSNLTYSVYKDTAGNYYILSFQDGSYTVTDADTANNILSNH